MHPSSPTNTARSWKKLCGRPLFYEKPASSAMLLTNRAHQQCGRCEVSLLCVLSTIRPHRPRFVPTVVAQQTETPSITASKCATDRKIATEQTPTANLGILEARIGVHGFGLYAKQDVRLKHTRRPLLEVPLENCLTITTNNTEQHQQLQSDLLFQWQRANNVNMPASLQRFLTTVNRDYHARLAAWLLWAVKQPGSNFQHYATHYLPAVGHRVTLFQPGPKEKLLIGMCPCLSQEVTMVSTPLREITLSQLKKACVKCQLDATSQELTWAVDMVRSRMFGASTTGRDGDPDLAMFVPWVDIINHSCAPDNQCSYVFNFNKRAFQVYLDTPPSPAPRWPLGNWPLGHENDVVVRAGTELVASYGSHRSNANLMMVYGFFVPGNPGEQLLPPGWAKDAKLRKVLAADEWSGDWHLPQWLVERAVNIMLERRPATVGPDGDSSTHVSRIKSLRCLSSQSTSSLNEDIPRLHQTIGALQAAVEQMLLMLPPKHHANTSKDSTMTPNTLHAETGQATPSTGTSTLSPKKGNAGEDVDHRVEGLEGYLDERHNLLMNDSDSGDSSGGGGLVGALEGYLEERRKLLMVAQEMLQLCLQLVTDELPLLVEQ